MARLFPTNRLVPPKNGTANLLAIGEAPGHDEQAVGEPFVGASGRMLDGWFGKIGISRHELWLSNVISCRPPDNKFPTAEGVDYISYDEGKQSVQHCLDHHLLPFLRSREWEKIYLIGAQALEWLTGKAPLLDWGGTPLPIPALDPAKRIAVATVHPAALMRDSDMLPIVFRDLRRPLEIPPEYYTTNGQPDAIGAFAGGPFVVDIETNIPPTQITMFALSNKSEHATHFEFNDGTRAALRDLVGKARVIVNQNYLQFDGPQLAKHGVPYNLNPDECFVFDTMLVHHVLWPTLPHDLGFLGRQYLTKPFWKNWKASGDSEAIYNCRDADGTWQVYEQLRCALDKEPRLKKLYSEVQVPLARVCQLMTTTGIMTDPKEAVKMSTKADDIITREEQVLPPHMRRQRIWKNRHIPAPLGTLSEKTGKPLKILKEPYETWSSAPWRTPEKVADFLYKEMGLEERHDAKGKVTTGKKALAIIFNKSRRPEVRAIRETRKWASRKAICDKLATEVAEVLHASFNPHGTGTGRLSSTGGVHKIQLQNITEEMRVLFVPSRPGNVLWSVDFSQMEARLAAYFAKDKARAARFDLPGFNEYKHAAGIFLGIPAQDVVKDHAPDSIYHKAKTIVLGVDRALGKRKISLENDIPEPEVAEMLQQWKAQIPATMVWQEQIGNKAKRDKMLWSPFNRRGLFYGPNAYTAGISFLPQSAGADVIIRCMIALMWQRIEWPRHWVERVVRVIRPLPEPARLLLQVHDELVGECEESAVAEVKDCLTTVLTQPWAELDGLSLPVNFATGPNWLEMEAA